MHFKLLLAALLLPLLLSACSGRNAYSIGQAWQRNQCFKLDDAQERSRCLSTANTQYEDYKRQTESSQ